MSQKFRKNESSMAARWKGALNFRERNNSHTCLVNWKVKEEKNTIGKIDFLFKYDDNAVYSLSHLLPENCQISVRSLTARQSIASNSYSLVMCEILSAIENEHQLQCHLNQMVTFYTSLFQDIDTESGLLTCGNVKNLIKSVDPMKTLVCFMYNEVDEVKMDRMMTQALCQSTQCDTAKFTICSRQLACVHIDSYTVPCWLDCLVKEDTINTARVVIQQVIDNQNLDATDQHKLEALVAMISEYQNNI